MAAPGVLMENTLLLAAAGGLFVLALLALGYMAMRRSARRRQQQQARSERSREEELRELGLSEVRPRTPRSSEDRSRARSEPAPTLATTTAPEEPAAPPEAREPALTPGHVDELAGGAAASPESWPENHRESAYDPEVEPVREDSAAVLNTTDDHPFWQKHSPTTITSFLRACWAATEAQTALIAAAEADGSYTLLSVRSHHPSVRAEGRLAADSFLSVASEDRPLTVLEANDPLVRDLPYYRTRMNVGGVAILPVPADGSSVSLAVDLPPDHPGFTARQRKLLLGFADLLKMLMAHPTEEPQARGVPTRRQIIAEEMERARRDDHPLALALVYRADAEAVATHGATAVAEAERGLRLLLEDLVQHGRLERFGELMFGAFLHEDKSTLATWAARVQEQAGANGYRVGIGIARLGSHRDADELRADAANALAEALQRREVVVFARPRLR